ncbi:MAG: hypothetical protein O4750_10385 [Trichodesmium sp. St18_bin3_1_1]|nr:hypothetical protein [Trichodesmium sp. St18_bin3_1_1]
MKSGVKNLRIYGKLRVKKKGPIGASSNNIYHFISFAEWDERLVNERPLQIMNTGNHTRIRNGFSLIIDDYEHRKSGDFTDGVSREYLG